MKVGKKLLAAGLVLALLVVLNVLASLLPAKADLTGDKLYSLTDGSKKILSGLQEPVEVEFFYSSSIEGLPIFIKNYADRVAEMLGQYAAHSGGKLTVKTTDPKADTPDEERAGRLGLQGQQMPGGGDRVFLGIVVTQADSQKTIPFLNLQRERFLEYDLSQLIFSVQKLDKPKLGLISGLPLAGRGGMPWAGQQGQPAQLIHQELEKTYEIVSVEATAKELPKDLAVLAVVHPQNLDAQLEYAIDQFILSGKPTFIALDPANRFMGSQQQSMMMGPPPGRSSNLARLFSAYGIDFSADQVVADETLGTQIPGSNGMPFAYPLLPTFKAANLSSDSPLTSQLQQLMFIESGSVGLASGSKLEMTPLVRTSKRSGSTAAAAVGMTPPEETAKSVVYEDKERVVAAFFRGTLKTAFPDGKPADTTPKDESKPAEAVPPAGTKDENFTKESKSPANLFIAGDADWLMDAYSVRRTEFLGMQSYVPLNDNLGFATNVLEALAGSEDLVSIRGKNSSLRPFTVIDDMERAAQKKYQARLDAIETDLRKLETQIGELVAKQSEQKLIVASPELQKSLADFREQEAKMRGERREIRRALREEIEGLKTRLIVLNLVAVPLLVAALGGVFFWRRSRRTLAARAAA